MKKLILILSLMFAAIICYGQSNDMPVRKAFTLKLAVNDTNFYQSDIGENPYMLPENTLQIYPSEKLFVEIELLNNEIKSMKNVRENLNPKKTLTIEFNQDTIGRKHEMMMLQINNPFDKKLIYKAYMYLLNMKKFVPTNVVPVEAGIASFETWPDIIVTLALTGWVFME